LLVACGSGGAVSSGGAGRNGTLGSSGNDSSGAGTSGSINARAARSWAPAAPSSVQAARSRVLRVAALGTAVQGAHGRCGRHDQRTGQPEAGRVRTVIAFDNGWLFNKGLPPARTNPALPTRIGER